LQTANDGSDGIKIEAAAPGGTFTIYHGGDGTGRLRVGSVDGIAITNTGDIHVGGGNIPLYRVSNQYCAGAGSLTFSATCSPSYSQNGSCYAGYNCNGGYAGCWRSSQIPYICDNTFTGLYIK
jgi:hypothetical protein